MIISRLYQLSKKRETINSFGLAILLCANPLSWLYPVDNIILAYAAFSLVIVLINNPIVTFINSNLLLIIGVFILFAFSYLAADIDKDTYFLYFYSFIAFGLTGILYASVPINYKTLFKTIFFIAFISLPGIYRVVTTDYSGMGDVSGFWMGISQGATRLVIGSILVLPILKTKFFKTLTLPVFIVYIGFMITLGTRGALLGILLFIALHYLNNKNKLSISTAFVFLVFIAVLNLFFIDILRLFVSVLGYVDLEFKAIEKILRMHDLNIDLSNGRDIIWGNALSGFLDSPIYGNGVSSYFNKYGIYPHNFLLEILYEGGILYGIPILYALLIFVQLVFSNKLTKKQKNIILFVFCAGILEVTFSNIYWRHVMFWYFIAYVLQQRKFLNSHKINNLRYE